MAIYVLCFKNIFLHIFSHQYEDLAKVDLNRISIFFYLPKLCLMFFQVLYNRSLNEYRALMKDDEQLCKRIEELKKR